MLYIRGPFAKDSISLCISNFILEYSTQTIITSSIEMTGCSYYVCKMIGISLISMHPVVHDQQLYSLQWTQILTMLCWFRVRLCESLCADHLPLSIFTYELGLCVFPHPNQLVIRICMHTEANNEMDHKGHLILFKLYNTLTMLW